MKQSLFIWHLLLLAAIFTGCGETADQPATTGPVNLSFNLMADSTYRYSIKNNIAIKQDIDKDNSININQNMTLISTYKVAALAKKARTIAVTYERITMSSGNQLFSLDYDSETDNGTDIMYEDLRNLIDKTFKMTVTPTGKVASSEPVIKGAHEGQGAYNFNDSSIRKIMQHALEIYPGKAVQPGDVWESSYETSVGFANVRVRNKYRLQSVKDGVAHIELQGRLSSDRAEQAQNSSMKLDGVQSGSFDILIADGLVQNGKISQQLSGEMNITGKNSPVTVESDIYIMGSVKH